MRKGILLASVMLAFGCIATQATLRNPSPVKRTPVPANQVRIYRTADQVVGRYEGVALLHAQGETEWTNERTMIESMRKKAGKVGANGLILDSIREPGTVERIAGAVLKTGSTRRGRAVAIFLFPDSTAPNP